MTGAVPTLRSERREQVTVKHRMEFPYGGLTRSVRLPDGAKGEEDTAEFRDGVLTVRVPVPKTETGTATGTFPVLHG
ncbi:Hsp20/alpha crystallin family protein [Streptomyces sp. NPDC001914]|uniref:Hsp20/alpha crystallin family protein n=1 Tax=Streptomyces sp. NPDC001914 TaxID=3364623 RepID=UPI00368FDBAB